MTPKWLEWAQRLQALAQNGLTYSNNPFDIERYSAIRQIAAEMMAGSSDAGVEKLRDFFETQTGYATPKVDVRGVVFRGDSLLLVKEIADGLWTLPGGWADIGDSPAEAVVREIREESGYEARAAKLLMVHDRSRHSHPPMPFYVYKLFFLCELLGGEARTSRETSGAHFFAQDKIPALSVGRVTPDQIRRVFEHYRHPEWPTEFD